jgi:hypothetical protein
MDSADDISVWFGRKSWASGEKVTPDGTYVPAKSGFGYVIEIVNNSNQTIDWMNMDVGLVHDGKGSEDVFDGESTRTHHYSRTGVEKFTFELTPRSLRPGGRYWTALSAADYNRSAEAPSDTWELFRIYGYRAGRPFVINLAGNYYIPPPAKVVERIDSKCFIATAAFSDANHPTVVELRRTRDEVLKKTIVGRKFVKFYYKHSPRIAAAMSERPLVRSVSRGILTPLAYTIKYSRLGASMTVATMKRILNCTL